MKKSKILIAGAGGYLGRATQKKFTGLGYEVFTLTRNRSKVSERDFYVDYENNGIEIPDDLQFKVMLNFCGENLASKRWSQARKEKLIQSRIEPVTRLIDWIKEDKIRTETFMSASGTGFYGFSERGLFSEESERGEGFLAELCEEWELPLKRNPDLCRMLSLRIAAVLSEEGGLISKLKPVFSFGLGGRLGSGKQLMSWISLTDFLRAVEFLIDNENIKGPVNLCAPKPVTNLEFTRCFADSLKRPAVFSVPALFLKIALGEMAEELLLASQGAYPKVLNNSGFSFCHQDISGYYSS